MQKNSTTEVYNKKVGHRYVLTSDENLTDEQLVLLNKFINVLKKPNNDTTIKLIKDLLNNK
jgi:hypothetical protein